MFLSFARIIWGLGQANALASDAPKQGAAGARMSIATRII
jgi:hypothetical protein